mmetsp:Transcript_13948/g.56558  ORF Transcript_13948/g.56558 Transcript_13948/m.56558 type:complete len:220 (-) Transcript_13948:254-913(-)
MMMSWLRLDAFFYFHASEERRTNRHAPAPPSNSQSRVLVAAEQLDQLVVLEFWLDYDDLVDQHPARVRVLPAVELQGGPVEHGIHAPVVDLHALEVVRLRLVDALLVALLLQYHREVVAGIQMPRVEVDRPPVALLGLTELLDRLVEVPHPVPRVGVVGLGLHRVREERAALLDERVERPFDLPDPLLGVAVETRRVCLLQRDPARRLEPLERRSPAHP